MPKLAELVVEVSADVDKALRGLNTVDSKISGMAKGAGRAAAALAPVSAAIGLVGVAGVRAFTAYEDKLAEFVARTGIVGDELAQVEELAAQIGMTTQFSATQALDAMLQLAAGGMSVADTLATVDEVLALAAAGGIEFGTAADAVTDVLSQFGLEAEDATAVVNTLSAAAGASSADVNDMIMALNNVGPVAAQMGIDVETAAATLAVLADNGIKGAEAGTALKSMLVNMTRPTEEVAAAWEELGTSFYDAEGNARPLPDVLADINAGLADKSPEEANRLLVQLAGSYGVVALTALLSSGSVEEMQTAMSEQASAAEIAAARSDTLSGKLAMLKSSLELLLINAMKPAVDEYFMPFIEKVTEISNSIVAWTQENPQLTEQIALFGAALVGLTTTLGTVSAALTVVSGLIGALTSPLTIIIALLFAVGWAWKTNFLGIGDLINSAIDNIKKFVDEVKAAFEEGGWSAAAKKAVGLILSGMWNLATDVREKILKPLAQEIAEAAGDIYNSALDYGKKLLNGVVDAVTSLPSKVLEFLNLVVLDLQNAAPIMYNDALELGTKILNGIVDALLALPSQVLDLLNKMVQEIKNVASTVYNDALELGGKILDGIVDALLALPNKVIDLLNSALPDEINLGSIEKTVDLGILGGKQTVRLEFGTIDLPDNPLPPFVLPFAEGGIVRRPTLGLLGEAGPEAVVPLARLGRSIVLNGPVIVQGVRDTRDFWQQLENEAVRRNVQFGVAGGV